MPRVLNKHTDKIPPDAKYVGRPSILGNPFTHLPVRGTAAQFQVNTRREAVDKYGPYAKERLKRDPKFAQAIRDLRGHDLVCWCAPLPCHADILLELANA